MRSFFVALALSGLFTAPAAAQSFVGEWVATADVQGTQISEALSVRKEADGYSLTATPITEVPPGSPTAGPGVDIKLEGDNFSYKRLASTAQADVEIVYTGVVKGDTFTGKAVIGDFVIPYTGVRAK